MSKFKQGERVCVANTTDANNFHRSMSNFVPAPGTEGVVDRTDYMGAWVAWEGRHGCSKPKTWVPDDILALAARHEEKIVIYREGRSVFAKNLLTGKIAEAKCNPEDQFNFRIGAELAFDRLMGREEKKPEEPKYYSGKVVCVERGPGKLGVLEETGTYWWTVGKVYDVVNGVVRDDDGDRRRPVETLEELNELEDKYAKFIALVE